MPKPNRKKLLILTKLLAALFVIPLAALFTQQNPIPFYPTRFIVFAQYKNPDLNNDGQVNHEDARQLLSAWGLISPDAAEDLDSNGQVNSLDAAIVIANWIGGTATPTPTPSPGTPSPSPTPTPPSTASCLNQSGPLETISGNQTSGYDKRNLTNNTKINAATARWLDQGDNPVKVGGSNLCFYGGYIEGNFPAATTSWERTHGANALSIYSTPNVTIENLKIFEHGDGIKLRDTGTKNFHIKGVYLHDMRDDCIEHDWLQSGIIEDSLLDGCYAVFAARARSSDPVDGANNVWVIRNNLAYLHDQRNTSWGMNTYGHGLFFKLNPPSRPGKSPKMDFHNNIFRADSDTSDDHRSLDIIPPDRERIRSCSNNIMVWTGGGEYPGHISNDPASGEPCITVTSDISVWNNAKAKWLSDHGY